MALVSLSSKCFNVVETALEAVKTGDAHRLAVILKSIKEDGSLLQQQASDLCDQLSKAEEEHKQKIEVLTREMNELYEVEMQLKNRKQALETKKTALADERERCKRNKQACSRRYQAAEREKEEAEKKFEELRDWWWVPIYGTGLIIRELIENNKQKVRDAYREMKGYERDMEKAESEIRSANSTILQAEEEQNTISKKVDNLRRQREACHDKLGDIKTLTSFIMQAVTFWEEVNMLTKAATVETKQLQRIVNLASEKNSVKILRSSGTQTKMRSFKERWMEVAEMMTSDKNNVVLIDKLCLSQRKTFYGRLSDAFFYAVFFVLVCCGSIYIIYHIFVILVIFYILNRLIVTLC